MANGFTDKQRMFIEEYLRCWNATGAALRAGYSEKSAHAIGWENLRKPEIAEEIKRRISSTAMSADEVLMRLADQARGVDSHYYRKGLVWVPDGDDGAVQQVVGLDFDQLLADGKGHLIKSLSYSKDGELTRVEFYDAQAALTQLGRAHGLFTDVTKHTGTGEGGAIVIANLGMSTEGL